MSGLVRLEVVATVVASGVLAGAVGARTGVQGQKVPTPVRQNPNVNRPITNENVDSAVVTLLQRLVAVYGPIANSNDRPNPYTRIEPFGEPPPGNNGEWAAVTGAEGAADGYVYVFHRCHANSCVGRKEPPLVKLDLRTGKRLATWGEGLMAFPHGFHVDYEGNLWTTDTGQGDAPGGHVVRKFARDGTLLMTIGQSGVAGDSPALMREPTDVVVSPEGTIFVTEGHLKNGPHSRLAKFAADGTFIARLGSTGQGHLQVSAPHGIAMDTQGRLFIADRDNNRILIWDQDGNYIDQWHQFGRPSGVYIDHTNTIYVADSESWGPDNPGWKKGIRIGSANTGQVHYFIEDIESRDFAHSGAEGVGVDTRGNVYGAVVRRQMLERHEPGVEQPTRGATWPARKPN
jgi:sugar lactone lactonase YvrE